MTGIRNIFLLFTSLILLLQVGCAHYPALQEPDVKMFNQTINSKDLRDSLSLGKLTAGMPHFVVSQLFKLYVWYHRPDFYSTDVSQRDTLCIFYDDTVYCSVINYLNKSTVLTVRDSLPQIPADTSLFAEIRYNDHPWREVSYWYHIEILSNSKTFKLGDTNYELYPIELLEFNNEPLSSFKWREVNNED